MMLPVVATIAALALTPPSAPQRIERLVAMARLDAAVRYFDPAVATRASSWDSLFAANVVRIADAPNSAEYARLVSALMSALHDDPPPSGPALKRISYNGFPSPSMQGSGGYGIVWRDGSSADTYRVDMGENVQANVRLTIASTDPTQSASPVAVPVSPAWNAPYPAAGYRILGAARLWNTIRLFFPYKALIGENWDDQLRAALPAVEDARDELGYGKAIATLATHIHDSHVNVGSMALRAFIGAAPIGAAARLIENQLVITRIADPAAQQAGLRVGDVVVSVDGEAIANRIARISPFFPASTPQALRARLQSSLMSGPPTVPAQLVVRGATGGERALTVPRNTLNAQALQKHRTGSIIRMLPDNVGYVDLDRLPLAMVDSAFRVLAGTKAIILDVRGYPLGTAWAIAPRLNTHGDNTGAAKFKRLVVSSPDTSQTSLVEFTQPIPPAGGVPTYSGRTVMLVDERTISQAEHTGLFFEAANGTTFIGSPSMGANGDVTQFTIPGGIGITFTGHDVRHADGRQLQRVGLQPTLTVLPTIAGIRAGRDEVLEAAHKFVGGTGNVPPDSLRDVVPATLFLAAEPRIPGWSLGGDDSFRVGADRSVMRTGTSSGHITARSTAPIGFAAMNQTLRADEYRGKRIRYSAYVKSRDVAGIGAGLWMRVDGNGGTMAFDNMGARLITGTTDWHLVSIVLDVPADAIGIAFGLLLASGGEVWVDDATFEVVGADVPTTNAMQPRADPTAVERQRAMYAAAPLQPGNLGFEIPN